MTEAVNLIADMDRMGVVRRLKVDRFTPVETRDVACPGARRTGRRRRRRDHAHAGRGRAVHRRGDGHRVPRRRHDPADRRHVDAREERRAYGAIRGEDADLAPRRAPARGDDGALAEAAMLGRRFSLKDLREMSLGVRRLDARPGGDHRVADTGGGGGIAGRARGGRPGRLHLPARAGAGVRRELSPARRRAIHAAIVGLLLAGDPSPARASDARPSREGRRRRRPSACGSR